MPLMDIGKILVPVSGAAVDEAAVATAFAVAKAFGAQVEAVFAYPDPARAVPAVGVPFTSEALHAMIAGQEQLTTVQRKAAVETIRRDAKRHGLNLSGTHTPSCVLHEEMGTLAELMLRRTRLCDLVVFPPLMADGFVDVRDAFLRVLVQGGKPVLVSRPDGGFNPEAAAAIAWDGSVSASRAVQAAAPLLASARAITAIVIDGGDADGAIGELKTYLQLHGLKCAHVSVPCGKDGVGAALLAKAAELGAGLMVMGGYGHSHLRETFFGGATADVLSAATMPVLLAH